MTEVLTEDAAPVEVWRDWTAEDAAKQSRRVCSIAGCKDAPVRVKETTTERKDGTPRTRKHVYCAEHVPE